MALVQQTRAARILRDDRPTIILAADHGYFGVVRGLERPRTVLEPLLAHADVLMADLRVLRALDGVPRALPVILRASGGGSTIEVPVPGYRQEPARRAYRERTGMDPADVVCRFEHRLEAGDELTEQEWSDYDLAHSIFVVPDTLAEERLILTPPQIAAAGGHAAAVSVYIGSHHQTQTLENLATMARLAHEQDMPVLGVVAVGKGLGFREKDADYLTRSGAIVVAHGADMVKVYNCGRGFNEVVSASVVPVVVAGGKVPKGADPVRDTLTLAADSITQGARGLDFGRRVWRDAHPPAMIRALVHIATGLGVADAMSAYRDYAAEPLGSRQA